MNIYTPNDKRPAGQELLGGKGWNLVRIAQAGFQVPEFLILTTDAFVTAATSTDTIESAWSTTEQLPMPDGLRQELHREIATHFPEATTPQFFAVRSSAVGEDGGDHSWAGAFESFLYVSPSGIVDAVESVWRSARSPRVRAYLQSNGLPDQPPPIAVVLQRMIDASVSGVAFGIDTIRGDRHAVVISSLYGLGEGLVSGRLDADLFTVTNSSITQQIANKSRMIRFDREHGTGTHEVDTPKELHQRPSLDEATLRRLAATTADLNRLYGRPQDVEWCIADGNLFVLQSRPITNLSAIPADKSRTRIIWDNSNIIESYPGVTTPLTFSFIDPVYTEVYKELCRILGVDSETIERNSDVFRMLGMVEGRVYYNLLNWYRVLALLPGYRVNAGFMEGMMGVSERLEEVPHIVPSKRNAYLQLARTVYRLVANLLRLPRLINRFQEHLDATLHPYERTDFYGKTPRELRDIFRELERSLLQRWRVPILNDFYTMIFFGLLRKLIEKWNLDASGTLQNDLLTGQGGIISAEPPERLAEIASSIRQHPELVEIFATASPEFVMSRLNEHPDIARPLGDYLAKFGDRYMGELKLETVTPAENPDLIIPLLAPWLRHSPDSEKTKSVEDPIHQHAERRARLRLRGPFRKLIFNYVLRQTRERVRNRENLRFARTRVYAVVRHIVLAIGADFVASGAISEKRDVIFLTLPEIFSWIEGGSVTADLRGLIKLRRDEFERFQDSSPDDRFETWGEIYTGNSFRAEKKSTTRESSTLEDDNVLQGIACSPGVVRAVARIVTDPTNAGDLTGTILVAERTDPGWAPLFPLVLGVVVERGSPLSHSAIIAREMGIPAIVGVSGLMRQLRDGETIEIDGSTGIIRRL